MRVGFERLLREDYPEATDEQIARAAEVFEIAHAERVGKPLEMVDFVIFGQVGVEIAKIMGGPPRDD